MRSGRRILFGAALVAGLVGVAIALAGRTPEAKARKIAAELLELHRQWETHPNVPALFESLTNLPFHDGAAAIGRGSVERRYNVLGLKWSEFYYICQPAAATNASEWTLYRAWYWYPPFSRRRELARRKVVTTEVD